MRIALGLLLLLGCCQRDDFPGASGDGGLPDRGAPEDQVDAGALLDASPEDGDMEALANPGTLSWTSLSAGALPNSVCGLSAGRLECLTSRGQLLQGGDAHDVQGEVVTLPEGSDFIRVSGQADRGCVLDESWQVECWGALPSPPAGVLVDEPIFVEVAAGEDFVCALTSIGYLRCWGSAALQDHDLGLASAFSHIVAEDYRVCAWSPAYTGVCLVAPASGSGRFSRRDYGSPIRYLDLYRGEVWMIEEPGSSALGFASGRILDPTFGNEPLREVAAGELAVCALGEDETVRCVPRAEGEYQPPPEGVRFTALVAAGPSHCGLDDSGHVWCWGRFPPNPHTGNVQGP